MSPCLTCIWACPHLDLLLPLERQSEVEHVAILLPETVDRVGCPVYQGVVGKG
jgi:hypothetical protein